jgi:hypothetical protein
MHGGLFHDRRFLATTNGAQRLAFVLMCLLVWFSGQPFGLPLRANGASVSSAAAPMLIVRAILTESAGDSDPPPRYVVGPDGLWWHLDATNVVGGLPRVSTASIGAGGVATVRQLIAAARLDELPTTAPSPTHSSPSGDHEQIEFRYRHPDGRLITQTASSGQPTVAAVLRALQDPTELGATRGAKVIAPSVLRLSATETSAPAGVPIGRWTVRGELLRSTTLRCVALRDSNASRLRQDVARIASSAASRAATGVTVGADGIASVWMRSGSLVVQLRIRIVAPGERDCPALARS